MPASRMRRAGDAFRGECCNFKVISFVVSNAGCMKMQRMGFCPYRVKVGVALVRTLAGLAADLGSRAVPRLG